MKAIYVILCSMLFLVSITIYSQVVDTAGSATTDPGFTYCVNGNDIVNGTTYYYLENDSIFVSISTVDVDNNQQGALHKGVPMDIVHKRKYRDNIDWGQLVLSHSILNGFDYPAYNVDLGTILINNDSKSISSFGHWNDDPMIFIQADYRLLPGTPVLKIGLKIINNSGIPFNGYIMYQADCEEAGEQYCYVPGIGWNNTLASTGWTRNYIYNGPEQGLHSSNPSHGIAWVVDNPVALFMPGYMFGAWFKVDVPINDTSEINLYHITDIPDNPGEPNYHCIKKWAENLTNLDPELWNYSRITGLVEDIHGNALPHIPIIIEDAGGALIPGIFTDTAGKYEVFLENNQYSFGINSIGYYYMSRSIVASKDSILDFTLATNSALTPVTVWAGSGKTFENGLVSGTESDIIIENSSLAMSIANSSIDPQLPFSSRGRPLDFAAKGLDDDLGWIHLSFASKVKPNGISAWGYESVKYNTVYVVQSNSNIAMVRAEGHYIEIKGVNMDSVVVFDNIPVISTFIVEPDNQYIYTKTKIFNNTLIPQSFWIGDVLNHDGSGQTAYIPGVGPVNTPYANPETYQPSEPWMAMYGGNPQAYACIYEGDFAKTFKAYGNGSWIMSIDSIEIQAGMSYQYNRYMVATNTNGYPGIVHAIRDVYNDIISKQSGISAELNISKKILKNGDTLLATLKIKNDAKLPSPALDIFMVLPEQLSTTAIPSIKISTIPAFGDTLLTWILKGETGGKDFINFTIKDTGLASIYKSESITVNAGGWYAGDNHMHSLYSDGTAAVADIVTAAYLRGLSWLTITDHNTLQHQNDANIENAKYSDFLTMFGQEVTSNTGHFLAYNISKVKPWDNSLYTYQQLLDSVLLDNNGTGIAYLAHPFNSGRPWVDWSVTGYQGLEVWNGSNPPDHIENTQAFAKWDALNIQGMHLYGIANSDAHYPGKIGDPHIVAYLDSLNQEAVYNAFNKGCIYGTNGPKLGFNIEGNMMGSNAKIPPGGRVVNINISGEAPGEITNVRLIKNGLAISTWNPVSDTFDLLYSDYAMIDDFYRLEFSAANGFAFSNPIWMAEGKSDASLSMITVDGYPLPGFKDTIYSYQYGVVNGVTQAPLVGAIVNDTNASTVITQAKNLYGTISERSATINITAEDGLSTEQYEVEFTILTGGNELIESNTLLIYPVPARDKIIIEYSEFSEDISFELLNLQGQIILSGNINSRSHPIDIGLLNNGLYIIKIYRNKYCMISRKIIKGSE